MKTAISLVRGNGLSSGAIALKTGLYSHADIVLPAGLVLDVPAKGMKASALWSAEGCPGGWLLGARSDLVGGSKGVAIRPPDYETWRHRMVLEFELTQEQWSAGWAFLQEQLGDDYDWTAVAAFAFNRDWRQDGKWFCSELAARWLEICKFIPTLYLPVNYVDPGDLSIATQCAGALIGLHY